MKQIPRSPAGGRVALPLLMTLLFCGARNASADTLVVGTNVAAIDVPAVQAAVSSGGVVRLRGLFSFDLPPIDGRTILVDRAVTIVGEPDAAGAPPTISGGMRPFQVNAPGAPFDLANVRFANARLTAIDVRAASAVGVRNCRIDRVQPEFSPVLGSFFAGGMLLGFVSNGAVAGDIEISGNTVDIGGGPTDRTEAIVVITVGNAASPAAIHIHDNLVVNTTAHGIDLRNITGSALVERNSIETGPIGGQQVSLTDRFVDGIRCLGAGAYEVRQNLIVIGYENAAGIRLQGGAGPIADAIVESNEIVMAPLAGAAAGEESAGIEVRRGARANAILHNRLRGFARAAFALVAERGTWPSDTTFSGNNIATFDAGFADVVIGAGVLNTSIDGGSGSLDDLGYGTTAHGAFRPRGGQ